MISVIIPSYNAGHLLEESIESCLNQSYRNFEVIVVDDGSTDNTQGIIDRYKGNIHYLRQDNQGCPTARNAGASTARGEWLLFLDADDILYPNALKHFCDNMADTDSGVIFGITRQKKKGKLVKRFSTDIEGYPPYPTIRIFFKNTIATPGAAIVKKEVFDRTGGFDVRLISSEDRNFWLKCGLLTEFKACAEDVILKRPQKDSMVKDSNRMVYAGFQAQKYFMSWCRNNDIDISFLPWSEKEIFAKNLERATRKKSWRAFDAILLDSRPAMLEDPLFIKYKRISRYVPLIRIYDRIARMLMPR